MFWGMEYNLEDVFVVQKRVMRIIFKLPFKQSCRGMFRKNNILTVFGLYILDCLTFFSRNKDRFTGNTVESCYNTRILDSILPLLIAERNPSYMCMKLFNELPNEIKEVSNGKKFVKRVKTLLIEREPYNIREFFDR